MLSTALSASGSSSRRAIASASSLSCTRRSHSGEYISSAACIASSRARSGPSSSPTTRSAASSVAMRASSTIPVSLCMPRVLRQRGADELVLVADPLGDLRRLQQRLPKARVPGLALGLAALDQQLASLCVGGSAAAASSSSDALIPPARLVGGELLQRLVAGQGRVPKRRLGVEVPAPDQCRASSANGFRPARLVAPSRPRPSDAARSPCGAQARGRGSAASADARTDSEPAARHLAEDRVSDRASRPRPAGELTSTISDTRSRSNSSPMTAAAPGSDGVVIDEPQPPGERLGDAHGQVRAGLDAVGQPPPTVLADQRAGVGESRTSSVMKNGLPSAVVLRGVGQAGIGGPRRRVRDPSH